MRARSHPEVASTREALALLGLTGPTEGAALTTAFRAAVKAARPDQPGGDETRFRKVIAAWRLLQAEARGPGLEPPPVRSAPLPVVSITPLEALRGGRAKIGRAHV